MEIVHIGRVPIGTGIPKIAAPIVGETAAEILSNAAAVAASACDIAEWRADFFESVSDRGAMLALLPQLRRALNGKPLLFTIRTAKEGGGHAVSAAEHIALTVAAAESGFVDAVDLEIHTGDEPVRRCVNAVHRAGCVVIGSAHDFVRTPSQETLVGWLRQARSLGADIAKIAVMPRSRADVLTLLCATEEASRDADYPIAAMSMSALGAVTRLCGEAVGSAITFAVANLPSAPGQIPVDELAAALRAIHSAR